MGHIGTAKSLCGLHDYLTDYLDEIQRETIYKHWYFGHMHTNRELYDYDAKCLYEQIERIV